jgi:hypothetical protein
VREVDLKGRAHRLYEDFRREAAGFGNPFGVCRVILMARIVPEQLTVDLDDPLVEERIERAIKSVCSNREQRE